MSELDLRVLKTITEDKVQGLSFAYHFGPELFNDDNRLFGKLCIDYLKAFREVPTRRTLVERHTPNTDIINTINQAWDRIEGLQYDVREYPYDLSQLKKRYQHSAIDAIRDKAAREDDDDPEAFFKDLSLRIQDVARLDLSRSYTQKPVADYVEEFQQQYEAKKLHPEQAPEVMTGYSLIDILTGGLAPAELIMVGGESGAGKSMLLNNMAIQLWMQGNSIDKLDDFERGYSVLYFSLEMPYDDCFIRFLSRLANVPSRQLSSGRLNQQQERRVEKAYEFMRLYQEAGYYFDIVDVPRGATIEEIELRYNDAMLRYRPDIVVVDYMGLMHNPLFAKEQDWLRMGAIAASLHEFARAYDVIVLSAAQLTDIKRSSQSKKGEDDKRVGMHRWGRSSLIMHHVNLAIQIESRRDEINYPDLQYHMVKNRKGALGRGNMIKNFANATLVDVPCPKDVDPGDISGDVATLIEKVQTREDEEEDE